MDFRRLGGCLLGLVSLVILWALIYLAAVEISHLVVHVLNSFDKGTH